MVAQAKAIGSIVLLVVAVLALAWVKSWYDDRLTLPYRNQVIAANANAKAAKDKLTSEVTRVEKLLAADRVTLKETLIEIEAQRNELQVQLAATATDRLCSGPDARELLDDAIERSNPRPAARARAPVRPRTAAPNTATTEKQGITDAEWRSWASAIVKLREFDMARFNRLAGIIEALPYVTIIEDRPMEQ